MFFSGIHSLRGACGNDFSGGVYFGRRTYSLAVGCGSSPCACLQEKEFAHCGNRSCGGCSAFDCDITDNLAVHISKFADLDDVGDLIAYYLLELYKNDKQMTKALKKMFEENPVACFLKLTDKSVIATLNTTQSRFADDGYRFYEFIRNGVLHTMEINHAVNFKWLFTMKINGKTEYICAGKNLERLYFNDTKTVNSNIYFDVWFNCYL